MAERSGRVAVVTGAGSGIGRAIALRLAEDGAAVALLGRTRETLEEVAGKARGQTRVVTADVADPLAVDAAFDEVAQALGPLHILVANAGVGGPDQEGGEERWDAILRTNLDGAYHCLRAFEARWASEEDWRHALVISSCVARFGVPGIVAYSTAKAGQLGMVRALAAEWAPRKVRVNAICPGWVETGMAEARMRELARQAARPFAELRRELLEAVPLQRISQPEEIAALVAFLISAEAVSFTGQAFDPNNGAWMG